MSDTAAPPTPREADAGAPRDGLAVYFGLGVVLGTIFLKSEVASWFRIQEMFRFQAVHMYGVIGSAVAVGALGVFLLKKTGARSRTGAEIVFVDPAEAQVGVHHAAGGVCFGLGWGLLGACPGPIYALLGSGLPALGVALLAAAAGAWVYGLLRPHLPH